MSLGHGAIGELPIGDTPSPLVRVAATTDKARLMVMSREGAGQVITIREGGSKVTMSREGASQGILIGSHTP